MHRALAIHLDREEMDELVRAEEVGVISRKMGNQMKAIFSFMEKNSEQYFQMLTNTFTPHNIPQMQQWRYDLQQDKGQYKLEYPELMRAAAIARRACDDHDHGSYLLIAYLQQAAAVLAQKMGVKEVER